MKLIKEVKFNTAIHDMTTEELKQIVEENTLKEMVEYMSKQQIPYLHARQVGLEMNFFVWQHKNKWELIVNPKAIINKKEKVLNTVELSYTERTDKGTPKLFKTQRAYKCLAIYDKHTNAVKKKRASFNLKGLESSVWQQMVDVSLGKNIVRFEAK